jgi:hypothetical protein
MIFVDGVDIGDVADVALRDRRMLSADGIFIIVADRVRAGRLVGRPAGGAGARRAVPGRQHDLHRSSCARRSRIPWTVPRAAVTEIDVLESFLHDDLATFIYDKAQATPDGLAGRCLRCDFSPLRAGRRISAPTPARGMPARRTRTPCAGDPTCGKHSRRAGSRCRASRRRSDSQTGPDMRAW